MLIEAATLTIDLHRTAIDEKLIDQFEKQASDARLDSLRKSLFAGERINISEDRAAHHTALRDPSGNHPHAVEARAVLERTLQLAGDINSGNWLGSTGKRIEKVVNIGIGGSDLGPRMITTALASGSQQPEVAFVANIDPAELASVLSELNQETTLFIVASKSFGTLETLENGLAARRWLLEKMDTDGLSRHLVAITANVQKAVEYGVAEENILPLWDWVGGRYSLWSAIGLPIAIAIGEVAYRSLLKGAHDMDEHFRNSPLANNAPALLALLEIHYQRTMGIQSLAVLPYSFELRLLPDYLQQLCMESNGKSVKADGSPVDEPTCGVLWGSAGTVGQHSFHQLLHQGTAKFSVDFVLPLRSTLTGEAEDKRHQHLVANCLAQSQAFESGKNLQAALIEVESAGHKGDEAEALARQKVVAGGRPNTIIAMETVNAESLGALVALYEHKTFVQSVIWGINAFDQWGVELGKQLSGPIFAAMEAQTASGVDETSQRWIDRFIEANR